MILLKEQRPLECITRCKGGLSQEMVTLSHLPGKSPNFQTQFVCDTAFDPFQNFKATMPPVDGAVIADGCNSHTLTNRL